MSLRYTNYDIFAKSRITVKNMRYFQILVFDDNPIQLLFLTASEQCAAGLMNDALASWRRQMMLEQGIVVRRRRTPGEVGYGLIYGATQPLPVKPDGLKAMITVI